MGTITLYDDKPYDKVFSAQVISCEKCDGRYKVVLDRTLFFPEQGGQTSDIGTLSGATVYDVQVSDDTVYHYVDTAFESGQTVEGEIDWKHRFNNMQQHTGEHIFTGLAHNKYGAENVGFHLSDNTVTLDLDIELDQSQIDELEWLSNEVIADNLPIRCWYPDPEELAQMSYRSKIAIDGAVRIVEIEGIDKCACCAPHVSSTAQVGLLKVLSFGKYKGGTRVYILCGLRAVSDYKKNQDLLTEAKQILNCQTEEVPAKAKNLLEDNKTVKYQISEIKAKQLLKQIETYPSELVDVIIFTSDLDARNMRDGVNKLVENHTGLCAIFSGDDENGYSFVIGSSTRDCAVIAAGLRELLGAKGGGSKQMAQGSINATRSQIENTI